MLLTVLLVAATGGVLLFLGRRWSEMPAPAPPPREPEGGSRSVGPPRACPPAGRPDQDIGPESDEWPEDEEETTGDRTPVGTIPDRMAIDHPLLVKAAAQAIESGGGSSRYFGHEGDVLYFNLAALPDPEERARACAILLSLQEAPGAGPAGVVEVIWLLRRIAVD